MIDDVGTRRILRQIVNSYRRGEDIEQLVARAEEYLKPQQEDEDHGTLYLYRKGCKCSLCREANAIHCATWRVNKRLEATIEKVISMAEQSN